METNYVNTYIPTVSEQIQLNEIQEEGYEVLRFETNRGTSQSISKESETSKFNWRLGVVIFAISLIVSLVSSIIAGSVVNSTAKNDNNILKGSTWSIWSRWGACTANCNGGLRSRNRTCPDKICIGNDNDVSLCNNDACPGSMWSIWSKWGACTASCNGGLRSRNRTCPDNICIGNGNDISLCNNDACPGGTWSMWSAWGSCTATCNGGLRSRNRSCPDKECIGNDNDVSLCGNGACPATAVFFSVKAIHQTLVNGVMTFTSNVHNVGNGYNMTAGKFTCNVPGLYYFSFTFVATSTSTTTKDTYCYAKHNGIGIVRAYTSHNKYTSWQSASAATYLNLSAGDTVYLGSCTGFEYIQFQQYTGMFAGALIAPD